MKRTLLLLVLRVAVSAAIAVPILLFGVFLPHNRALDEVDRQAHSVTSVYKALEQGQKKLQDLPDPKSIRLRTFETAREYAQTINTLLPGFNIDLPEKASVLSPQWKGLKITMYNDIVDDPTYAIAVARASTTIQNSKTFLDHHYSIMRAVANVLDYNPTKDIDGKNGEELYNSLLAAEDGLKITLQRIKDTPKYKDSSIQDIVNRIGQIEATRKVYENAVSANRLNGVERTAYIEAFSSAQDFIIGNRQSFWDANYKTLLKDITLAETALRDYASLLNNL